MAKSQTTNSLIALNGLIQLTLGAVPAGEDHGEISVRKDEKVKATMIGWVKADRVKGEDGEYSPASFGMLRVRGVRVDQKVAGKDRIILQTDGGLRGVLFPVSAEDQAKQDKQPAYIYQGDLEDGKGGKLILFGYNRTGVNGRFLSCSSKLDVPGNGKAHAPAPAPVVDDGFGDDVPF
jgi:hypothetical protein